MPQVEIKKVYIVGHQQEREKTFSLLLDKGVLELADAQSGLLSSGEEGLLEGDAVPEQAAELDRRRSEARYCLDFLQRHFPLRKSFLEQFTGSRMVLSESRYREYVASRDEVSSLYQVCQEADETLARLRSEETRCRNLMNELAPWKDLDLPLEEVQDNYYTFTTLGSVPTGSFASLEASAAGAESPILLLQQAADSEYDYFLCLGLLEDRADWEELAKRSAVAPVRFEDLEGTAAAVIAAQEEGLKKIAGEREELLAEIADYLEHRPLLMACFDYLDNEYAKQEAIANLARTADSFILEGWVPAPELTSLDQTLAGETETVILQSRDPAPEEDVPVLLENRGPVEAYEVVTRLYSTPRRGEPDPTPYMAPFFFVFFGICLSDAGYGAILALLAYLASRRLRLAGMGRQLVYLLFLGGISAAFFGLLMGGFFGDLVGLPPLWFNPLDEPMTMLLYCFAIGLLHIYFGMAVQAWYNIKAGRPLHALFDQGFWFVFINGLILLLLPGMGEVGRWLALGGGAGLVLTQGRNQQGVLLRFLSGLLGLYNITGYLSDVLSYSRLLALGLASMVIASAINAMGEMVAGSFIGILVMVLLLVVGHLFNIIISTLSAYVHTSRLQYIEFFSKFFEGGGRSFQPFRAQGRYVELVDPGEI